MSMTSKNPSFETIASDAARVADSVRSYFQPNSSMLVPAAVFFSGAVVGAIAALALAPVTGRDFRKMVASRIANWRDAAEEGVESIRKSDDNVHAGARKSDDNAHSGSQAASQGGKSPNQDGRPAKPAQA